jgi:hypothetical protein
MTRDLLPRLTNLKAVVFEVFPSFLPSIGLETVGEQIRRLRNLRVGAPPPERSVTPLRSPAHVDTPESTPAPMWESTLGALAIGATIPTSQLSREIEADPGLGIIRRLIAEFRASMLVSSIRLTSRLLMLALGPDIFRAILQDYWSKRSPSPFAATEAVTFLRYLEEIDLKVPRLHEIAAYERSAIETLLDGKVRQVRFGVDPLPMLRALAEGRLTDIPGDPGDFVIEITPDGAPGVARAVA